MKISCLIAVAAAFSANAALAQSPSTASSKRAAAAAQGPIVVADPETIFEAVKPCRAFDTSAANGGGAIAATTARAFEIAGTGFKDQGGPAGGCGIPTSATAVTVSLTSTGSSAKGTLIAYPFRSGVPRTTSLSFSPGLDATAGVTVGLFQRRLALSATGGSTQVAGDVTGYFAPQIEVYVNADGSIFSYTPRIVSATRTAAGTYAVKIDRDVVYCAGTASPIDDGFVATANTLGSNTVYVATLKLTNGKFVHTDAGFNLAVHC